MEISMDFSGLIKFSFLAVIIYAIFGVYGLALLFGYIGLSIALTLGWVKYCNLIRSYVKPIITSILDTDYYKLTMQQVVFNDFYDAQAKYTFINRGANIFPVGFAEALRNEVNALARLKLSKKERAWLLNSNVVRGINVFSQEYVDWLSTFRFKPEQLTITQDGGTLSVAIEGPWRETILWEVPLMAIISELYFRMKGLKPSRDWEDKICEKGLRLNNYGVKWVDFGTRRRFSKEVQDMVSFYMRKCPNYLGTSNPYFAMKYGIPAVGTYAHEAVMAMAVKYGITNANRKWMRHWLNTYKGRLSIALTDTFTTDVFFRDFSGEFAREFEGVRQDSGEPEQFAVKMLAHYLAMGVDPKTKKLVFSDKLDPDRAIGLHQTFNSEINCVMGIGTNLTADCGHKALNMVVKLSAIDFGDGMKPVVKLSDDVGKNTGTPEAVMAVKKELGLI